jgi:AraC-like DNA-binding protein
MSATFYVPSQPLSAYIKCFWYSVGHPQHLRLKMLPMPSLHLMINFGDTFQVYEAGHAKPFAACAESWFVGLWSEYHIMDSPRNMEILNVSFKPGGAYPFLRLPLSELHNQIVSLDVIWGQFAAEIRERLSSVPTMEARFDLLEQLLVARLHEAPQGLNAVQYAVAQIARHRGALSIGALSDLMGISQKHLITQFKGMVGGTPKELARLYRFRYVLQSINPTQPIDWMQVAGQSCYYDQSHFNKDFKAFTGHTPTEYLPLRSQIHDEKSATFRHLSRLPIG